MNDSGYAVNSALRNTCIWVGALASGNHTINGRLASVTNGVTTTVANRTLLIYIFNGNEFFYLDDTTAQTATSTAYIDDSVATTTFTPVGDCKALAFYAITNLFGSTERYTGKKICINIAGEDKYCESSKSSNSAVTSPDSVATVYVQALTTVSTTIKGRLSTNAGTQTVTVNRHVLGVLLFDPSVVLDLVSSVTPVSSTSPTLANDTQASITRTRDATNELLILGQADKQYGTTGSLRGLAYGLNVDNSDVALSRSSSAYTSDTESSLVAYATTIAAGSHTINGRLATNSGSSASVVSTRVLIALWFPVVTVIQMSSSISGGGSQTSSITEWHSPTANFSGTPLTGNLPLTVQFTDSSTVPTSIVDNSDFEAGLPENTLAGDTAIGQSSTYKRTGTYSMRVISTNAGTDNCVLVNQAVLELSSNTQYYWEVYVYSPDAATIVPSGMFLAEEGGSWRGIAGGAINGNGAAQSLPAGTWVKICGTGTAGSAWSVDSRLVMRPAGVGGAYDTTHYIYYDDLKVYPITWAWTFGDTATSSAQNPSHQYTSRGVYDVSLTITNVSLSSSRTRASYVTINELLNISGSISGGGSSTAPLFNFKRIASSISGGGALTAALYLPIYNRLLKTNEWYTIKTSDGSFLYTSDTTPGVDLSSSVTGGGSPIASLFNFERIASSISGGGALAAIYIVLTYLPITSLISGSGTQNASIIEFGRVSSSITGGGSQSSSIIIFTYLPIASSISAGAAQTANVMKSSYVISSVTGGGSETAIIKELTQITASIGGGGSQTFNPVTFERISSNLTATSALTAYMALISGTVELTSSISGAGIQNASIIEFGRVSSSITGGGSQSSSIVIFTYLPIASSISAGAAQTANVMKSSYVISSVTGGGSEIAIIKELAQITASIGGGGSQTFNPVTFERISSNLTATSALTAYMTLISGIAELTSSMSGGGSESANIIEFERIVSSISGGGNSTASPTRIAYIASAISSTGSVTAAFSLNKIVSSAVTGGGNSTANSIILEMLSSNIIGIGYSSITHTTTIYTSSTLAGGGIQYANFSYIGRDFKYPLTYIIYQKSRNATIYQKSKTVTFV